MRRKAREEKEWHDCLPTGRGTKRLKAQLFGHLIIVHQRRPIYPMYTSSQGFYVRLRRNAAFSLLCFYRSRPLISLKLSCFSLFCGRNIACFKTGCWVLLRYQHPNTNVPTLSCSDKSIPFNKFLSMVNITSARDLLDQRTLVESGFV